MTKHYRTTANIRFYRPIHNSQRYDDDVVSEMQYMRKRVAVEVNDQFLHRKGLTLLINYMTDFKHSWDSRRTQKGPSVRLVRDSISCRAIVANMFQETLSFDDSVNHEEIISLYATVRNLLLHLVIMDRTVAKFDKKVQNFREGSLTTRYFFSKSQNLAFSCRDVYTKQKFRRRFSENFNHSTYSTLRRDTQITIKACWRSSRVNPYLY